MNTSKFAVDFALTFAIVLIVSVIVSFLYNLLFHGSGFISWESSFQFALTLGIALPLIRQREKK